MRFHNFWPILRDLMSTKLFKIGRSRNLMSIKFSKWVTWESLCLQNLNIGYQQNTLSAKFLRKVMYQSTRSFQIFLVSTIFLNNVDSVKLQHDVIEVLGVIFSVIKWITKTKKRQLGNINIFSVLLNFNILKTIPWQKFLFVKFDKTRHPREPISTEDFKSHHPRKFFSVKCKKFVVLPDRGDFCPQIFFPLKYTNGTGIV